MPRSVLRPGVFAAGGFSHLVNAKRFGPRWEKGGESGEQGCRRRERERGWRSCFPFPTSGKLLFYCAYKTGLRFNGEVWFERHLKAVSSCQTGC